MHPGLGGVAFRGDGEGLVAERGAGGEGFLGAVDVDPCRVEFGVAVAGEVGEAGVVGREGGYACAFGFAAGRAEGHAAQDDAGFGREGGCGGEKHFVRLFGSVGVEIVFGGLAVCLFDGWFRLLW